MKYKVQAMNEKGKIIHDYGEFKTEDVLSHSILDVILNHLPKGWQIILIPLAIWVLSLIF